MKKIAAVIVSLVILFSSLPGVGAAKDADYVAKELTAYLYSLDDTVTMTCLFKDGLDIPFIDPEDYLNRAYTVEFSTAKNGDGTFTVSSVNGEMVIDPAKDTIHFDCFEEFAYYDALYPYEREDDFADYVMDDASYIYTKDGADPNALDLDLGKYGIRCNVILPGTIKTKRWRAMGSKQAISGRLTPIGDISDFDDIANAAWFLGTDESRNITGAELTVDGGMSCQLYPQILNDLLKKETE